MNIAFIVPRYGMDILGGAESLTRIVAEHLNKNNVNVEVLTTCAKDHFTWDNYYKPGVYNINGVTVKKFEVNARNSKLYDEINNRIGMNQVVSEEEEETWIKESVNSNSLLNYIRESCDKYDFLIYIPWVFGTSYWGVDICPEKSLLIPCLDTSPYARLKIYRAMFKKCKGIIYNTEPEKILAKNYFDIENTKTAIIGMGFDIAVSPDGERFRRKYGVNNRFMLYVGRRENGKNTHLLMEYFCKFKEHNDTDLKLVLIGGGQVNIQKKHTNDVLVLNFVPEQDKFDAFAASIFSCQPSMYESFSMVMMESWICQTPVLVHEDCNVTKDHCVKSNGGLYFKNYDEFEACIHLLTQNSVLRNKMGENGRKYVVNNYSWDVVLKKFNYIFSEWEK